MPERHGDRCRRQAAVRGPERIERGGRISHRVPTGERYAIACVLGGPGRRTLYAITAATLSLHAAHDTFESRIECVQVAVPGAGVP